MTKREREKNSLLYFDKNKDGRKHKNRDHTDNDLENYVSLKDRLTYVKVWWMRN